MIRLKVSKITTEIHESLLGELLWAQEQLGIRDAFIQNARMVQLHGSSSLGNLLGRPERLREGPSVLVHFYVLPEFCDPVMQFLIRACGLDMPGRGSLLAASVEIIASKSFIATITGMKVPRTMLNPLPLLGSLMSIASIVQRGQGNTVARVALSLGASVPAITFGEGTGLRQAGTATDHHSGGQGNRYHGGFRPRRRGSHADHH